MNVIRILYSSLNLLSNFRILTIRNDLTILTPDVILFEPMVIVSIKSRHDVTITIKSTMFQPDKK